VNLPLALVCYEDLLPGTQLVNRLESLKYRVQTVSAGELAGASAGAGLMLIFCDLGSKSADVCDVIRRLRRDSATAHVPIVAFADDAEGELAQHAKTAGATVIASDAAVVPHLEQFIQQALQVE
jgi:CheY-like chemotaxis protein